MRLKQGDLHPGNVSFLCYSEEAEEYIEIGALNGLFVLGRSMGFIGESAITNLLCFAAY